MGRRTGSQCGTSETPRRRPQRSPSSAHRASRRHAPAQTAAAARRPRAPTQTAAQRSACRVTCSTQRATWHTTRHVTYSMARLPRPLRVSGATLNFGRSLRFALSVPVSCLLPTRPSGRVAVRRAHRRKLHARRLCDVLDVDERAPLAHRRRTFGAFQWRRLSWICTRHGRRLHRSSCIGAGRRQFAPEGEADRPRRIPQLVCPRHVRSHNRLRPLQAHAHPSLAHASKRS